MDDVIFEQNKGQYTHWLTRCSRSSDLHSWHQWKNYWWYTPPPLRWPSTNQKWTPGCAATLNSIFIIYLGIWPSLSKDLLTLRLLLKQYGWELCEGLVCTVRPLNYQAFNKEPLSYLTSFSSYIWGPTISGRVELTLQKRDQRSTQESCMRTQND